MTLEQHLKQEFAKRKKANARYSLRAFAKALEMDQSLLSKILRGTRKPTLDLTKKVSENLGLDVKGLRTHSPSRKRALSHYDRLQGEANQLVSHWEHFAILELMKTTSFRSDAEWMAKRLGLSTIEIQVALTRLEIFGFLSLETVPWKLTKPNNMWTDYQQTSGSKKYLQKKLLEMAMESIEGTAFDRREHASLTVQCSPKLMPEIKKRLFAFCQEMDRFIEEQGPHDDVYQMTIGFFPLTQGEIK